MSTIQRTLISLGGLINLHLLSPGVTVIVPDRQLLWGGHVIDLVHQLTDWLSTAKQL